MAELCRAPCFSFGEKQLKVVLPQLRAPTACASCTAVPLLDQALIDAERHAQLNTRDVPCA